jgi:hypothetical protein
MTESVSREPGAEWLVPQDLGPGLSVPLLQQSGEAIEPSQSKSPTSWIVSTQRATPAR